MLKKPILFFLDEGQLAMLQREFASKMPQARHSGIRIIINVQNPSIIPPEVRGNVDAVITFQLTDGRDKDAISRSLDLSKEASEMIGSLERGHCIARIPRSNWKHPFFAHALRIEFSNPNDLVDRRTQEFLGRFAWEPLDVNEKAQARDKDQDKATGERLDHRSLSVLMDLLDAEKASEGWRSRCERLGIHSASTQQSIEKRLLAAGYVSTLQMKISLRGRPQKFLWPSEKAISEYKVKWLRTKGNRETQLATVLLKRRLTRLGWRVFEEVKCGEHFVDLLIRHKQSDLIRTIDIARTTARYEVGYAKECIGHFEEQRDHRHVIVGMGTDVVQAIRKRMDADSDMVMEQRVELVTLAQALDRLWDS